MMIIIIIMYSHIADCKFNFVLDLFLEKYFFRTNNHRSPSATAQNENLTRTLISFIYFMHLYTSTKLYTHIFPLLTFIHTYIHHILCSACDRITNYTPIFSFVLSMFIIRNLYSFFVFFFFIS